MTRLIWLLSLCIITFGCGATAELRDTEPIYEAVLRHELRGQANGAGTFLSVEGRDPSPELLRRLRAQWPALEAASAKQHGFGRQIHAGDLKWLDTDTAEVRGGFSDGVDGRVSRYRVVKKGGKWIVAEAETEASS